MKCLRLATVTDYFSPLCVLHLYLVNGNVVGWEELDTDFEKNFIPVFFFKFVSSVERRELCITNKCGKRLSCTIGINYVTLSLRLKKHLPKSGLRTLKAKIFLLQLSSKTPNCGVL